MRTIKEVSVNRRIVCFLALLFLMIVSITAVFGEDLGTTKPKRVGLSSERLARIDSFMDRSMDDRQIAGAVVLIAKEGKIAYNKAYGLADIESGAPMKTDSMFRIASMSKALTSTAIMILYEEGRLLMTQPISDFIPGFKDPKVIEPSSAGDTYSLVPAHREITVRHLLNHTSGLTYGSGLHSDIYKKAGMTVGLEPVEGTIGEKIDKLATLPLISHPGEQLNYGMSIDVLGYIVEIVSGKPLNEFMRERIFEPLGMKDTCFVLPEEKLPRLARIYTRDKNGGPMRKGDDPSYLTGTTYFSGGAGLISTADDYLRFAQMILNGGELNGVRILGKRTVEYMSENSIGDIWAPFRIHSGDKMGLGFGIRTERGEFDEMENLGIIGWDGAFYTRFWIDPKEKLVGIFMSQSRDWTNDLINRYRVLVYQSIVE